MLPQVWGPEFESQSSLKKSDVAVCSVASALRGRDKWVPRALWLASLVILVIFQFSEGPCLRAIRELGRHHDFHTGHMGPHALTLTCM